MYDQREVDKEGVEKMSSSSRLALQGESFIRFCFWNLPNGHVHLSCHFIVFFSLDKKRHGN